MGWKGRTSTTLQDNCKRKSSINIDMIIGVIMQNTPTKFKKAFESYSWMDEKNHVKVLIDYENATEIDDNNLSLVYILKRICLYSLNNRQEWTATSVTFKVLGDKHDTVLSVAPLNNSIEEATVIKKSSKFVIKLKKSNEGTWFQLKKSSS